MKVASSKFLKQVKPLLKELLQLLLEEYSYASILATDSITMTHRVSKNGTVVATDSLLSGRGFVIKVYDGKGYGEYSFNEITKELIPEIMNQIKNSLLPLKNHLPKGLEESKYGKLTDENIVFEESTEYEIDPIALGSEHIIELLTDIRTTGLAYDERILDVGTVQAMASKGEEVKYSFKGFSNLGGAELLKDMKSGLTKVIKDAIDLLDSEPIPPGTYECICTPETTGMIVHEAFGHGVEMDMFVKKRALAEQYIDEYVASPLVTMHDGAKGVNETATFFFDDEGVLAQDTIIIDKGILKRGISDAQSAMHLGTEPTGNGRRESYARKAYTRMTNTYFESGSSSVEEMIASIEYGFLLDVPTSGMEDPKNWGIQCMVNIAREIKDGKLTGKVFSPIVLTGYVPDLLKSITMISDTVTLGGCGFCGKGYKEWVKVSDGGPYIKAKIRLG